MKKKDPDTEVLTGKFAEFLVVRVNKVGGTYRRGMWGSYAKNIKSVTIKYKKGTGGLGR